MFKKEILNDIDHYTVYKAKDSIESKGIKTWTKDKLVKFGANGKISNVYVMHLYVRKKNWKEAKKIIDIE